jgi:hypothetical protein
MKSWIRIGPRGPTVIEFSFSTYGIPDAVVSFFLLFSIAIGLKIKLQHNNSIEKINNYYI